MSRWIRNAGLVLMPRRMQIWYFEKLRGGGGGTYDVGVIPTRWRLRKLLKAAGFTTVVSPRELWVIYAIKFLESVAYFAVYNLLAVYLSEDLGYDDLGAASIASTWLLAISVVTFFSSHPASVFRR